MAWTSPRTWVTSEHVTTDMMNTHIRDNLLAIDSYLDTACIEGSTILPLIVDSLGGGDNHRPVVDGTTYSEWHLCNGDTDIDSSGYDAPDLRNYWIRGAGGAYSQGDTGGALTANNAHTHGAGTLESAADSGLVNHTHDLTTDTAGPSAPHSNPYTDGTDVATDDHTHSFSATSGNPTTSPTHTHTTSGATASGGSATQDIKPPYRAQYYFIYIGS